jgi:hypothetical protein
LVARIAFITTYTCIASLKAPSQKPMWEKKDVLKRACTQCKDVGIFHRDSTRGASSSGGRLVLYFMMEPWRESYLWKSLDCFFPFGFGCFWTSDQHISISAKENTEARDVYVGQGHENPISIPKRYTLGHQVSVSMVWDFQYKTSIYQLKAACATNNKVWPPLYDSSGHLDAVYNMELLYMRKGVS